MSTQALPSEPGPARRTVVAAVGGVGLAAALAACGDSDSSDSAKTSGDGGTGGAAGSGAGAAGGGVLAKTADIPQGGGKVFADQGVVVTQPTAGTFKAFSATCTHQGCMVKDVADGTINCPCHGSKYDPATGGVTAGPAPRPLPAKTIKVEGDSIKLA
ncbi:MULTISPECIES: Rieske (2Fe-2S) protein [unclassified Streptomyces]|uniref:Rieske (2Fe-2S) protein n=1 Tax=unclassified Streptomyces TaxID=2593676 RepID=UPI0033CBF9B9